MLDKMLNQAADFVSAALNLVGLQPAPKISTDLLFVTSSVPQTPEFVAERAKLVAKFTDDYTELLKKHMGAENVVKWHDAPTYLGNTLRASPAKLKTLSAQHES